LHFAQLATTLAAIAARAVSPHRKKTEAPRRSVIIVDDEKSYVELMAAMIADNLDCPVHAFTRPLDALGALTTIAAGVIVTDYFMPEMDGIEFIRKAAKVAPRATFIMISGHNLEPLEHELSRLRRLKLRLQKPFGWRPLAAAVIEAWPGKDVPALRA
jgi:DNA-binding NtrC family response regulator